VKTNITPDLIRDALQFIAPNLPRDEWVRLAMAIKSEFPDDIGRDLFLQWSAAAENFDAAAARSTWNSIKASGGVTVATLLHLAKQNGFTLPKSDQAASKPDPAMVARLATERAERERLASEQALARHAAVADEAQALWDAASDSGESPYLTRKGVRSFGVRFDARGGVIVPMVDPARHLWNLQTILAERPFNGSDKLFLKGGRKSGLLHWCGDPEGAETLLICEGYATAATLFEATARPVAVAFDCGNLRHVAQALHAAHPNALIVICGDDDRDTAARTGHNPGRDKATAAARAVGGVAVFPDGLPEAGSDFNDLHARHGGDAGLAEVRRQIEAAIAKARAPAASPQSNAKRPAKGRAPATPPEGPSGPQSATDTEARPGPSLAHRFTLAPNGVWHQGIDPEGNPGSPEWVCSPLQVDALTRDEGGGSWGYLLIFSDPLNRPKQWAMPARMLSGDGSEFRGALLNQGLRIGASVRARNLLTAYIQTRAPDAFAICTDRVGWHAGAFVLPTETIAAPDADRVVFQSDSPIENTFKIRGAPEQWAERVGLLCIGNSRLVFAVACAFAGALLRPAGIESGGFHFRGDSSSGKTTALRMAASVWGGASYLQRWRATDNAIEMIAAQHCDGLLILDELAQVDPKTAGECAYLLANETSKSRATRNGATRPRLSWRLLFLSAGELSLGDHMAEGGARRIRPGQEVRLVDLPADAGMSIGIFETLHGRASAAGFADECTAQAAAVYGAVGRAWLDWCVSNVTTLKRQVQDATAALVAELMPAGATGQVARVAQRFAIVGVAGELATAAGLTGWPEGESERAARACFQSWLAARGGVGNGEIVAMLRQVRRFFELHAEGRFSWWHRGADDHQAKTLMRAGFRRLLNERGEPIKNDSEHFAEWGDRIAPTAAEKTSVEYFVLAETFRAEVCQGYDPAAVARVLSDHECLVPDKGRTFDCKPRLPGLGPARCYRIPAKIFELEL